MGAEHDDDVTYGESEYALVLQKSLMASKDQEKIKKIGFTRAYSISLAK